MAIPLIAQPISSVNCIACGPPLESLRILVAIRDLPIYEGNPRLLNEFINNVEEIFASCQSLRCNTTRQILFRVIRNKINKVIKLYFGVGHPTLFRQTNSNFFNLEPSQYSSNVQ